jgi:transposase
VDITITFCHATVKELTRRLQAAFRGGNLLLIKRLSALLLLAERRPVRRVAERLGVCKQTIYNWLHAFVLDRYDSLPTRRPPGRPAKLTAAQRQRLCELIDAGPEAAGYRTGCWNTALIQDLIVREFQRCYNVHYLAELLRHLGYSYHKARFVSDHLDEARRQQWLSVTWPAIVQQARQEQALLLFSDEASFAQWGSLGYTWSKRGQQPLVKTTGKRKGYKVLGLIEYLSGQLFYQGQTERFTAERYCAFLLMVLERTEQPLILIQDGARYHTARATQAFVAQHAERLQVYQLPSYSPDYNPIEHLWRNVKRQQTHNRYFATFEALTQAVEEGLSTFQNDQAAVKQLMGTLLDRALGLAQAA